MKILYSMAIYLLSCNLGHAAPVKSKGTQTRSTTLEKSSAKTKSLFKMSGAKWDYRPKNNARWKQIRVSAQGKLDVRKLFIKWAEKGKFSLIIDPEVKCHIFLRLSNVPLNVAMELLLKSCQLALSKDVFYRIVTQKRLKMEHKQVILSSIYRPIHMVLIPVERIPAKQLAHVIQHVILSKSGKAYAITKNLLIVKDYRSYIRSAEKFVGSLDSIGKKRQKDRE